ncbi:MAG: nucleotide exchange factor GrpE [Fimbriimonadaceae bacterium]|nr:nucleotide exchange factor GrpE [Fimbriimonadaceae bacterium]
MSESHHIPMDQTDFDDDLIKDAAPDDFEDELDQDVDEVTQNLIAELERERDELKDQLMRSLADLQNLRKRFQAEREDIRRYATENLARDLLPVLDNFERTLAAVQSGATLESLSEGVKLVDRQLRTALESVRLTRIHAVGMPFDPERHEAIATVPATDDVVDNTVVDEVEAGYQMAERVIRPARVRVARKS